MLELGTVLADRFRLERELGRGGMSVVYVAHDLKFEEEVALKLSAPAVNPADHKARFRREARIGSLLGARSSGYVRALDWGEHGRLLYMVMDLVEEAQDLDLTQGTLRERLKRLARVVSLVADCHELGVVHRDLKPANCLIDGAGKIYLADFGLAKVIGQSDEAEKLPASDSLGNLTQTGMAMGTPYYMAPEQLMDASSVDARADVYALGVMLYLALTGDLPYKGSLRELIAAQASVEIGKREAPRPRDVDPKVPRNLDRLCLHATVLDPEKRLGSARELLAGLGLEGSTHGTTTLNLDKRRVLAATRDVELAATQIEPTPSAAPDPANAPTEADARPEVPARPAQNARSTGKRSAPAGKRPASGRGTGKRSVPSGRQPAADARSSGRRPVASGMQPAADGRGTGKRPVASGRQPAADGRGTGKRPVASGRQPATSGQRPGGGAPPPTGKRAGGGGLAELQGLLAGQAEELSKRGRELRFRRGDELGRAGLGAEGWAFVELRRHFDASSPPGGIHSLRYAVNAMNAAGWGGLSATLYPNALGLRRAFPVAAGAGAARVALDALFGGRPEQVRALDRLVEHEPWREVLASLHPPPPPAAAEVPRLVAALRAAKLPHRAGPDRVLLPPRGGPPFELAWRGSDAQLSAQILTWSAPDEAQAAAGEPVESVLGLLRTLHERNRALASSLAWVAGRGVVLSLSLPAPGLSPAGLRDALGALERAAKLEQPRLVAL